MKTLWTPWRMEHVLDTAPPRDTCLFEPPGDSSHTPEELLLYRDRRSLCLMNRFPYTNGHLLVAPVRHVACITDLSPEETASLMALVSAATGILREILRPDGFNLGCNIGSEAGAGVAGHLHYHIVPRWRDDHNFMTVVADVRAIPEHIDTTYEKLLPRFQAYYHARKNT